MLSLTALATLFAAGTLVFILGYMFVHGAASLSWNFFTKLPTPVGETGGGMANAILGSAKLLLLATCIGVPIGFLGGVYLAEFGGSHFSFVVRYVRSFERRSVDRDRNFRLLPDRHPAKALLDARGRFRARCDDDSHRHPQLGGVFAQCAAVSSRGSHGAGGIKVQSDLDGGRSRRQGGSDHWYHAEPGARGWRNRSAVVHQFQQSLLEPGMG